MEPEQRGRASRASSTSSLGREVRCGCQYYQSDSLLPERRALVGRPPSRTMQQPPAVRCSATMSEHEYEPIAAPSPSPKPAYPPVVRITETDVVAVADSDDSIDDRARLPPELTRAGDVVLPLDGKIEDNAMEGREMGETGDTSEEQETPQQLQERLEDRYLSAPTPGGESRTDCEVNTSQVDSLALEELPLRRGARGLPQRLKTQAGKLRTRLKNIQRPTFAFADRQKSDKPRSTSSARSDRSRPEKRPSRMDRIRSSFSERTRFNRPRFSLPDRSTFHLPERPKFNLKKPNIRLPNALTRVKKSPATNEQRSTESTVGSRRNIFDFSTYPRIFDKKPKSRGEYATSTPKDSRAQSAESATFPRTRKGPPASDRWAQRFEETTAYIDEDRSDPETAVERARPWRRPSLEAPRLSIGMPDEALASLPWEEKRRLEQLRYSEYEHESTETSEHQGLPRSEASRTEEEVSERDRMELEPRIYDLDVKEDMAQSEGGEEDWSMVKKMAQEDFRPVLRSKSLEEVLHAREEEQYGSNFPMVDPRRYGVHKTPSEEEEEEYDEEMDEDEENEPSSAQSEREQQPSSGSSCDRRRRGVIEEIDSDEFFLREGGLSQGDTNLGKYLSHEIRDALRADAINALADDDMIPIPPQRPTRRRTSRKQQQQDSFESYDAMPPVRPNRSRRSESADEQFRERTRSDSRHRIVYQAEGVLERGTPEPLDDIVVVKPIRRKSKSSLRSRSQVPLEPPRPPSPTPPPPVVPTRRKRLRKETPAERRNGDIGPMCNGHTEWTGADAAPEKPLPLPPATIVPLQDERAAYTVEGLMMADSEEDIRKLVTRLRDEENVEPVPVPPKRRSRSRGTSVAQDEDRTSHGAESLPEAGYVEEDIPPDEMDFGRDLSGYAIIDKREKPPRPPPPRRKRDKFATTPRPLPPKRPQRAYSTLGPGKTRDVEVLSEAFVTAMEPVESTAYIEVDSDDGEQKNLRSTEVLSKMQGRPLPAPPRPPRLRKDHSLERSAPITQEFSAETTTATQTDPLPDDMVIEEEITQAKLVVAPSRSGSQIMVSTERIPSPSSMPTPPVPPLPVSQRLRKEEQTEPSYDTVSLTDPSPARERESMEDRHLSAPHLDPTPEEPRTRALHSAVSPDEPVRISNLEVGDLRVDRLSVSQIEASKIVASEVDALLITASELKSLGATVEDSFSPSIIKELMAIRSHLETVAASRARESQTRAIETETKTDIPVTESRTVEQEPRDQQTAVNDEKAMPNEDQKVVKREVTETRDRGTPVTHTLAVAQVDVTEMPLTRTLSISRVVTDDRDIPSIHSPQAVESHEDKPLRISDSETPHSLSSGTAKELEVEVSRASLLPSVTTGETTESRLSPAPTSRQPPTTVPTHTAEFSTPPTEYREESPEQKSRKSRSRSPSPISISRTRETASPIRSLPPAISVTPDTPDVPSHGITSEMQPQRAVISYTSHADQSDRDSQRELSQSPITSFPITGTHLIAFPASQVPAQFLALTSQTSQRVDSDPSIADSTRQLIRILRLTGIKAMRHFIGYMSTMTSGEPTTEKIRQVELTLCALLLLIAGLLIFFFGGTRTVTHHHHWDYFNPPK
ncbi:titin isoform X1 [Hylaeus anthracinus]|uniref:titin isoform X1 n=1 Tax=Hylaeus anthracinus TaxID=313031 RepID=UPI0023BA19C9|nr:titin isoform X1 [Hylaeus anthracinus]